MADKRSKVAMLPTEDKHSDFPIIKGINSEELHTMIDGLYEHEDFIAQHLYFTVDEEPKDGDWVLLNYPSGKEVKQMVDGVPFENVECIRGENLVHNCGHRKIVATTDKSLKVVSTCCNGTGYDNRSRCRDCDGLGLQSLPQPSQSFIEKYCKVGGIDEVLIEYTSTTPSHINNWMDAVGRSVLKIKIDSHNTITIHPIKDSWDRGELTTLLKKCTYDNTGIDLEEVDFEVDNWMNENL